ncbi:MAG: IclR family transcriptional regulator [Candidatus Tectomicrobia bacterium]|nr:IclR family transcriptional regulator [Candidatus Tectomicrobia bacterium]
MSALSSGAKSRRGTQRGPRSKAEKSGYLIQSLAKGLQVLECFLRERGACRLTDVAEALRLDKSTVLRYCATLESLGYLGHDPSTKAYSLGPRAFDIGYAVLSRNDLRATIRSWLHLLAAEFDGSASMAVLRGASIVYVDRAVAESALTYSIPLGTSLPAHRTSIGTCLLAELSEEELEAALARIREADPDFTPARAEELRQKLRRARKRGYALNIEEFRRGLSSVAAPVRDPVTNAVLGGINVAGHSSDLTRDRLEKEVAPVLVEIARRITRNEPASGVLPTPSLPQVKTARRRKGGR